MQSKDRAKDLFRELVYDGINVDVIHAERTQQQREDIIRLLLHTGTSIIIVSWTVLDCTRLFYMYRFFLIFYHLFSCLFLFCRRRFRVGDIWVLICTDLMARGVDFKGVQMVINYDLPQSAVAYIHRIGRTGRAGKRGTAVTFFTEEDMPKLRPIANVIKVS